MFYDNDKYLIVKMCKYEAEIHIFIKTDYIRFNRYKLLHIL